ncbi:hypothetical protein [Vibrio litoralis]|uniref:hypothetical protein n=1 Tax=Vibrio litoralis TaxID=335972 RepID=UPI0018679F1C|nr:hypothetical protein [Vibrio litoralis]
MKSLSKILITLYFVCISFEAFSSSDDIYLGLTDSQHFRTYPYVDKAFRDENDKQYNEALEEMQRALVIVPNHAPYIKYTYTLSLLAGRPDSELIALVERLPQPDSGNLLLEIRIKESKSGKLYTPHEVDVMTSGLSKTQSQTWYENHLYQIEKIRGRQSALNWALNQQTKYKNLGAQRYEAYALSGSNKYPEALSILKNIKKNNQENDKDLEYLASLYLALEQDQEALVIVKDIPSKQGKQKIYASYIASLLDASRLSEARSELNRLYKSNILTAEMKNQRDYLNSLSSTQLNHFEVEGPNIDSCLNKVIDLTLSNLIKEAKINFSHCSPKNTPYTWLTVAEQLQAYSELRSTKFQTPLYENKRRDILISYYSNTQKWLEITELLDNNRLLSRHTRTLAYAYSHLGDYLRSSDLMFTLYQKEHVLSDVDFATYTRLNLPNRKIETAEMLNESFSYSSSEFLTSHNLVQRMAILANEDVSLFPVQTIETLNTKLRLESKIPASSWQNQKKCDDLSQDISPRHDYKKQAEAYCISAQDTRAAADLYVETLTPSSSEAERIIIAKWYAIASQYSKSYQYWSDVELSNLDNYSRYLYITTLNEMEYTQQADSLWRKTNFNKQNDQWWLLGFKIADNLDNKELAYQRLEKG